MKGSVSKITRISAATALLFGIASQTQAMPTEISLQQGIYQGAHHQQENVQSWLGIRYARPPVDERRWLPPQPLASGNTHFDATEPGNLCPQAQNGQSIGDEDCLNLNIYRPDSDESLPVLVYIHGGNNQTGKADEFSPAQLARDLNAVIVTVNYRLGALGFNPLAALKTADKQQASGNFTLLDQAQMLDWIKDNISQFGGDKDNVTVSGFSAGGRDVMAMLISPLFADKFDQAIVFSGGMTTSPVEKSQAVFRRVFAKLVVEDGRQPDEQAAERWLASADSDVREYLYQLDAARVATLMQKAGIRMGVFPHLYQDGVVLPEQGFRQATYNAVPTMMLTGHDEFSFFGFFDPYFAGTDWSRDVAKSQEYQFVYRYGGMLYRLFNVSASAEAMLPHFGAPIYAGQFNYGSDPTVTGAKMAKLGSFHGVFLPLIDPSLQLPFFGDAFKTEGAKALSTAFKAHLASFIRSGTPDRSQAVQWKAWNNNTVNNGESLYVMDANLSRFIAYRTGQTYSFADVNTLIENDMTVDDKTKTRLLHQVLNGRWFSASLDQQSQAEPIW